MVILELIFIFYFRVHQKRSVYGALFFSGLPKLYVHLQLTSAP